MIAVDVRPLGAIISWGRGAWRGSLEQRHGRDELVEVVDRSVLALALADYGAPRVGCARHVDVPFESVGNHPGLAILNSVLTVGGEGDMLLGGERGIRGLRQDFESRRVRSNEY